MSPNHGKKHVRRAVGNLTADPPAESRRFVVVAEAAGAGAPLALALVVAVRGTVGGGVRGRQGADRVRVATVGALGLRLGHRRPDGRKRRLQVAVALPVRSGPLTS